MNKLLIPSGIVSVSILFLGILFSIMDWPNASFIQSFGFGLLLAFFLFFLINGIAKGSTKIEKSWLIVGGVTMSLILLNIMFKIMHLQGAAKLIILSQLGLIITAVLLLIDALNEVDKTKKSIKTLFAFSLFTMLAYWL